MSKSNPWISFDYPSDSSNLMSSWLSEKQASLESLAVLAEIRAASMAKAYVTKGEETNSLCSEPCMMFTPSGVLNTQPIPPCSLCEALVSILWLNVRFRSLRSQYRGRRRVAFCQFQASTISFTRFPPELVVGLQR